MLWPSSRHMHQLAGRPEERRRRARRAWPCSARIAASCGSGPTCTSCQASRCSRCPGGRADCDAMLRKALYGKQELGDVIGIAYALDVLGWLSVKTGSPTRSAWLLGAAEPLWERGGSVRFSGTAVMEEFHQQAVAAATDLLGASSYEASYEAGAAYVQGLLDAGAGLEALRLQIPSWGSGTRSRVREGRFDRPQCPVEARGGGRGSESVRDDSFDLLPEGTDSLGAWRRLTSRGSRVCSGNLAWRARCGCCPSRHALRRPRRSSLAVRSGRSLTASCSPPTDRRCS